MLNSVIIASVSYLNTYWQRSLRASSQPAQSTSFTQHLKTLFLYAADGHILNTQRVRQIDKALSKRLQATGRKLLYSFWKDGFRILYVWYDMLEEFDFT